MRDYLHSLLEEIVQEGRKQGMDQRAIVRRAGLGDSTLSKAKAADDLRLSTLIKLSNAVGLKVTLGTSKPNLAKILGRDVFSQSDTAA